jgi:hypothetical protein
MAIREGNGRIVHIPNTDVLKNPLVNLLGTKAAGDLKSSSRLLAPH